MDVFIITGASKGIGFELLKQLRRKGNKVIGIARTTPEDAKDFVAADLSETNQLDELFRELLMKIGKQRLRLRLLIMQEWSIQLD